MEAVIVILLFLVLILLVAIRNSFLDKLNDMETHIHKLEQYIKENLHSTTLKEEPKKEIPAENAGYCCPRF